MAKYFATEKLSFEFGPQVGFLVSANSKIENSRTVIGRTETTSRDVDVKSSVTSTTFGLNVGAGFDVTKNINVGLRYNLGLTKVNKNSISGESDTKNNVFSLSLGYKF
jgi:opacity protein-like surface antigen